MFKNILNERCDECNEYELRTIGWIDGDNLVCNEGIYYGHNLFCAAKECQNSLFFFTRCSTVSLISNISCRNIITVLIGNTNLNTNSRKE